MSGKPYKNIPPIRDRIISLLRTGSTIDEAVEAVGVSPRGLYDWRQKDSEFDKDVKESIQYYKNKALTNRRRIAEAVIEDTLGAEDPRLCFDAAKYILDRSEDWVKPAPPPQSHKIGGDPENTTPVNLNISDNEAARRIALMFAKASMSKD